MRGRRWGIFGGLGAAGAAAVTAIILAVSGGGGAASFYVATTGSDTNPGSKAQPFATVQKACDSLPSGGTVEIEAGTYSSGFNLNGCKPSGTVTFQNPAGTNVYFAGDSTIQNSSNVVVQGDRIANGGGLSLGLVTISGTTAAPTSITLNNVNLYCQASTPWNVVTGSGGTWCAARVGITGGATVVWDGGDFGATASCDSSTDASCSGGNFGDGMNKTNPGTDGSAPTVTFENVKFHNYFTLDSAKHAEFVSNNAGTITYTDDQFVQCVAPAGYSGSSWNGCNSGMLFFGEASSQTVSSATLVGNILDGSGTTNGIDWGYNVEGEIHISFLYNTSVGAINPCSGTRSGGCAITGSNMTFAGNVAYNQTTDGCFSAATYSHNYWFTTDATTPASCGATDLHASNVAYSTLWTNEASDDFTPAASSPLIDAGESVYCPATDLFGTSRPQGAACDIGAVEG